MARRRRYLAQPVSPLDAKPLTAAQQRLLARHGVKLSRRCVVVRTPSLEVWIPASGGGMDRVLLTRDQRLSVEGAECEWEVR